MIAPTAAGCKGLWRQKDATFARRLAAADII
jgi:hypothetical protein